MNAYGTKTKGFFSKNNRHSTYPDIIPPSYDYPLPQSPVVHFHFPFDWATQSTNWYDDSATSSGVGTQVVTTVPYWKVGKFVAGINSATINIDVNGDFSTGTLAGHSGYFIGTSGTGGGIAISATDAGFNNTYGCKITAPSKNSYGVVGSGVMSVVSGDTACLSFKYTGTKPNFVALVGATNYSMKLETYYIGYNWYQARATQIFTTTNMIRPFIGYADVQNGDFETGTKNGWGGDGTSWPNATATVVEGSGYTGNYGLTLVTNANGAGGTQSTTKIWVESGDVVTVSYKYFKDSSTAPTTLLRTNVTWVSTTNTDVDIGGGWYQKTSTYTATYDTPIQVLLWHASANQSCAIDDVTMSIQNNNFSAGDTCIVDDIMFEKSWFPTEFVNGTREAGNLSPSNVLSKTAGTIVMWYNNTINQSGYLFKLGDSNNLIAVSTSGTFTNSLEFQVKSNDGDINDSTVQTLSTNFAYYSWIPVVFTWNFVGTTSCKLWTKCDGTIISSGYTAAVWAGPPDVDPDDFASFTICEGGTANILLDSFAAYTRVLTDAEITGILNSATLAAPAKGLPLIAESVQINDEYSEFMEMNSSYASSQDTPLRTYVDGNIYLLGCYELDYLWYSLLGYERVTSPSASGGLYNHVFEPSLTLDRYPAGAGDGYTAGKTWNLTRSFTLGIHRDLEDWIYNGCQINYVSMYLGQDATITVGIIGYNEYKGDYGLENIVIPTPDLFLFKDLTCEINGTQVSIQSAYININNDLEKFFGSRYILEPNRATNLQCVGSINLLYNDNIKTLVNTTGNRMKIGYTNTAGKRCYFYIPECRLNGTPIVPGRSHVSVELSFTAYRPASWPFSLSLDPISTRPLVVIETTTANNINQTVSY